MSIDWAFQEVITQLELSGEHEEAQRMRDQIEYLRRTEVTEDRSHSTDVEAWADPAMFEAEPHASYVPGMGVMPDVHLIWMTPDPLGAMAAMSSMYEGKVVREISEVTDDDRRRHWEASMDTHLKAPFESIKLHFMIDGVDRAFTHQLVRQRTAVYAQESMRFAVVDDLNTATTLPPSLMGTKDDDPMRVVWERGMETINGVYHGLVSAGMPQEDARGMLPTAVATRLNYITDLRNLSDHAGNRLCTQAQFHWRHVFAGIVKAIATYTPDWSWIPAGNSYATQAEMAELWEAKYRWQFEEIAKSELFRPVCYQIGKCPFNASYDRKCTIRQRVEIFNSRGIPSENWSTSTEGETIQTAEWLADPTAARR